MIYAITGATGHIGERIATHLLEKGQQVRVIGRSPEKLKPLVARGATAFWGTLEDREFLAQSFAQVDGVFTMVPPNPQAQDFRAFQNRVGGSVAAALTEARVKYVVNLSSQGAHLPAGTGPIAGLHDQEQRLGQLPGVNIVHLRPAFFMENLLLNIGLVRAQGINGSPLRGDLPIPVIATRDIARVAADYLLALNFSGKTVRDLLGQRDVSMAEMTRIIGAAVGNPALPYVQFPYDAARNAMVEMGLSADVARLFIEMYQALNDGRIMSGVPRTPENTTPTTFEEFAEDFAAAYRGAKAAA